MRRLVFFFLLLTCCEPLWAETTPLDLLKQGRYGEARTLLDAQSWAPCYHLLYIGLTDADAASACSLYQVVAIRFPRTDCDSLARNRLRDARDAGFVVVPIAEWSRALPGVVPLYAEAPAGHMEPVAKIDTAIPLQPVEQMDWVSEVKETTPAATRTPPPQPTPVKPPPVAKPVATAGDWYIQVGAFANSENAQRLATRLEKAGYGVKLVPGGTEAKKLLQVRVGGYAQRAELNPVMDKLKNDYKLPTAVVKE